MTTRKQQHHSEVIIIGAGAAGITAAYDLRKRHGIDSITILEAHPDRPLGRLQKNDTTFGTNCPVDLGGEWISVHPKILTRIIDDPKVVLEESTFLHNVPLSTRIGRCTIAGDPFDEYRWKNFTWHDFFLKYLVPTVEHDIVYDSPVASIAYGGAQRGVAVTTKIGITYHANAVLVAVPLQILTDGDIRFDPPLPAKKTKLHETVKTAGALKAFLEFDKCFYPKFFSFGSDLILFPGIDGARSFWDERWGQQPHDSKRQRHILGLFCLRRAYSKLYSQCKTQDDVLQSILKDLDKRFGGKASKHFVKGVVQDWSKEPFIRGGYSDYGEWRLTLKKDIQTLRKPVEGQIYFAGKYLPIDNEEYGYAHGAALSGRRAAQMIMDDHHPSE